MSTANRILSRVRISHVYLGLTGIKPRGQGEKWRVPAPWRNTSDRNLSLHDGRGTWYDFVMAEGGGVVDLIVRVRGGSREDALRWLADFSGVPLDDHAVSSVDRERWAQERRELERSLPRARYWRRAAVAMGEEVLEGLKGRLTDPAGTVRPEITELHDWTARLAWWRRIDGAELVNEYWKWAARHPKLTAGMVQAASFLERAEVRALLNYCAETTGEVTV